MVFSSQENLPLMNRPKMPIPCSSEHLDTWNDQLSAVWAGYEQARVDSISYHARFPLHKAPDWLRAISISAKFSGACWRWNYCDKGASPATHFPICYCVQNRRCRRKRLNDCLGEADRDGARVVQLSIGCVFPADICWVNSADSLHNGHHDDRFCGVL